MKERQKLTGESYYEVCKPVNNGHIVDWIPKSKHPSNAQLQRIIMPQADIPFPAAGPVIHWIREPFDLIISAYRYHMQSPENWEHHTSTCHGCNEEEWQDIFGICNYSCTYTELLRQAPSEKGVMIEAWNERGQINRMVNNFFAWSSNARVLHMSLSHLASDYERSMSCINHFLGGRGLDANSLHALNLLKASPNDAHTTAGKYNNTMIRSLLEAVPIWSKQNEIVRTAMDTIFQRQVELFDCPILQV